MIQLKNPFNRRDFHFSPDDITGFEIREFHWDSCSPTYGVEMVTKSDVRFETCSYDTPEEAESLRQKIMRLFLGE